MNRRSNRGRQLKSTWSLGGGDELKVLSAHRQFSIKIYLFKFEGLC